MDENKALWKKCVEFHGHECGGLTIGYKASLYAIALLGLAWAAAETRGACRRMRRSYASAKMMPAV